MTHLYETLFNIEEHLTNDDDIKLEIINQMHGHTDLNSISTYYDLISYNNLTRGDVNNINIFHMNSRSLTKNFDKITAFLNSLTTPPDIIAITETWLTNTNKHLYQLPGYLSSHLTRNIRPHGGVSVFISNELQSEQIHDLTIIHENLEINTVKITTNSTSYFICAIYRPHSKHINVQEFTNTLCTLLQKDIIKNKKVIIIGDLNINLLEHTTHQPTNNFLASLQTINFIPHISRPTRFPDSTNLGAPSLLDHIFLQILTVILHLV